MSNLFIIGNGFDLAHRLKTSYSHFREYLVQMEKEECAKVGEVSISEDCNLLKDNNIKYHFDSIVIPTMMNALSEIVNLSQLKDYSTGMNLLEQLDEIEQFTNDADKIVQWIKHGSGQYYVREGNESQAIKRFIAMLEPKTGMISHNTNLNNDLAFWQTMESEFNDTAVKIFKNGIGADETPFWLTLRFFIKMIDAVEGENWQDLETSMGTYNFEMIFGLFKELKSNDVYETCVENFFTLLYYNVFVLFNSWVLFTEIAFEQPVVNDDILSSLRPHIKKQQNGVELSFMMPKGNLEYTCDQVTCDRHPMAKEQLLQIFDRAESNYFFTFNYTQTLERIYGVSESDICHIHGVSQGTKNLNDLASEDLIFGHGRESFDTNVTNIVSTAYNITKKPVNQCIENNRLFFEKLEGVNNIYSYGFSFGDVDMPYIKKICQSIRNTTGVTWHFNDFRIEEHRALYEDKIRKIGFNGKFDKFHID
ncbi:MAG: bacteriophage abortive infection AbiH family protein [Treponema sp.]|nr:bacteriophage abortive infection AbiH family protein [Treponema sp.]